MTAVAYFSRCSSSIIASFDLLSGSGSKNFSTSTVPDPDFQIIHCKILKMCCLDRVECWRPKSARGIQRCTTKDWSQDADTKVVADGAHMIRTQYFVCNLLLASTVPSWASRTVTVPSIDPANRYDLPSLSSGAPSFST